MSEEIIDRLEIIVRKHWYFAECGTFEESACLLVRVCLCVCVLARRLLPLLLDIEPQKHLST